LVAATTRTCRHRHVAHLVEEQRAAVRGDEATASVARRPRERAPHVSEQLALHEVLRDRCAVELHERLLPPIAPLVHGRREQLFAHAGLALDQDRNLRLGHAARRLDQVVHRGRSCVDQRLGWAARGRLLLSEQPVLLGELPAVPIEQRRLLRVHDRERYEVAVHPGEVHALGGVGLAHATIERDEADVAPVGEQRHDHARVPVRQVEDAVVGVALFPGVVVLVQRRRATPAKRVSDRRETCER
jgi:hypothetical protein